MNLIFFFKTNVIAQYYIKAYKGKRKKDVDCEILRVYSLLLPVFRRTKFCKSFVRISRNM